MARYRVNCPNCWLDKVYYFPSEKDTRVVACPNCHRGTMATKINDKRGTLHEKDGVVGVFERDENDVKRDRVRRV